MKVCLIIDEPKNCSQCPLCSLADDVLKTHEGICDARDKLGINKRVKLNEKPSWCPLIPLT